MCAAPINNDGSFRQRSPDFLIAFPKMMRIADSRRGLVHHRGQLVELVVVPPARESAAAVPVVYTYVQIDSLNKRGAPSTVSLIVPKRAAFTGQDDGAVIR